MKEQENKPTEPATTGSTTNEENNQEWDFDNMDEDLYWYLWYKGYFEKPVTETKEENPLSDFDLFKQIVEAFTDKPF